jgi:hypothetical protein
MAVMYRLRRKRAESSLRPEELVLRTICSPFHVTPDHGTKTFRVSSAAYTPTDDGAVSVDLAQLLREDGLSLDSLYPSMASAVGLVSHPVSAIRDEELAVQHDPVVENWYHGGLTGNFTKKKRRKLASSCNAVVAIDTEAARRHWEAVHHDPLWA